MFTQNLKQIVRKLMRGKVYTIINITGLTVAITAALLIYSHVAKEFKTDQFHQNRDNIYRILTTENIHSQWANESSNPIGPASKDEIPGVKDYVRVERTYFTIGFDNTDNFSNPGKAVLADSQLFKVFDFPLIQGEAGEKTTPWVIISEKIAHRYFGSESPLGKTIKTKSRRGNITEYHITGVMKDIPTWSTLQADLVFNLQYKEYKNWGDFHAQTFLLLQPKADLKNIETKIKDLYHKNFNYNQTLFKLQPFKQIYFNSGDIRDTNHTSYGSKDMTLLLCGISLLILVLAVTNFMTIKTAQLTREIRDFAVQRCYGAGQNSILRQFITEVGVHLGISFLLATGLIYVLHPYFIQVITPSAPYDLHITIGEVGLFIVLLLILAVIVTFALYSFVQKRINKNGIKNSIQHIYNKQDIRKVFTVVQICIFCTLLCCSALLLKQMHYVQNKDLGYNPKNIISLWLPQQESFADEASRNPDILSISNGNYLPKLYNYTDNYSLSEKSEDEYPCEIIIGDANYLETYQIKLLQGSSVREKQDGNNSNTLLKAVVNEKLVEQAGFKDPIGKIIYSGGRKYQITGVVQDFHTHTLHSRIQPIIMSYTNCAITGEVLVRYRENKREAVIDFLNTLKKKHPDLAGDNIYGYKNYQYTDIYDKDFAFSKTINIFTLLAIFISGMGIFAFSLFMVENKRKEVAIRKVNGATEWQVVKKLSHNFVLQTLIACGIAIPVAYFAMQKWLQGFAYKTSLDWWYFVLFTILCTGIVLSIVCWQVLKSALQNPVNSIKNE